MPETRSHTIEVERANGWVHARCVSCSWSLAGRYFAGDVGLALADHLVETEAQRA